MRKVNSQLRKILTLHLNPGRFLSIKKKHAIIALINSLGKSAFLVILIILFSFLISILHPKILIEPDYIFIAATGVGKLDFYNVEVGNAFVASAIP